MVPGAGGVEPRPYAQQEAVRPGPITQHLVGQGPCALPWVRENLIRADVGIGPYESVSCGA